MKIKFCILLLFACAGYGASGQVLRPMTPRYNNRAVKGNIVYVANNIVSTAKSLTTEAPPGGTNRNNNRGATNLDVDGGTPVKYVAFGSTWKYLANNTRPANWETTGFADGAWPSGAGEFGYGDGDEVTCIPSGATGTICTPTPADVKYVTTYFRQTVNIANPALHANFIFKVIRDAGVAIYVNGIEVIRNNMPAGPLAHATLASGVAADDGNTIQTFSVSSGTFTAGNNVIAVELHQFSATGPDLSFDLELLGNPNVYTTLIPYGDNWKYLANNTRPVNWETTGFADAAWPSGNSEFGYGDGGEVTCIPSGGGGTVCTPTGNKWITTYFRKTINIPDVNLYSEFTIDLIRDDGAVVYVNGVEVVRSNMPTGTIAHATLASSIANAPQESNPYLFTIPKSYFVNGNNTIAVEVHQDVASSPDLSFNLALKGSTDLTFNSTSADLALPSCSNVLFAGLYWGATQGTNGTNTAWIAGETAVKLKIPGTSTYVNLTSTQTDYHNDVLVPGLGHTGYRCFRDITSLINKTNANGTYTVANVVSPLDIRNGAGGWTIVIAYEDPASIVRNLTVFDGSVIINLGDPALNVPISGFLTPPAGAVSCELGALVFDGDRANGDEFSFKQNSDPLVGTYTNMTPNATANLNDMWNSTISNNGVVVTTRNPAHLNTLGYDADIFSIPNAGNAVLGNSQSSASMRFGSTSENYIVQVATAAVSQYTPNFTMYKTSTDINGGLVLPGDQLRYQVHYTNDGNDASVQSTIVDNLPVGTSYKPGTLLINGIPKTDAAGDDEAEYDFVNNRVNFRLGVGANSSTGGELAISSSGNVSFEVYTAVSCAVFTCNNIISNSARIDYTGKISSLDLYDSTGVMSGGCVVPGAVTNTLSAPCFTLASDTSLINTCTSLSVTLPTVKYAGYLFYTATPFTAANRYDPAIPVTSTGTIYAFYDGAGTCDDTIRLHVSIRICDIDDDNDGIPDFLEINNPLATQDADSDGIPNWNDNTYPLFVDLNLDSFNDHFDPGADSDGDGILNFADNNFPGFTDVNGDGVNDQMDTDLDGIANHLDLDSDNDGIPDTVESFGVDANGDGRIDNFSDTDGDGLSQNVDGSNTGVSLSGIGLGILDTDGDGIANYLDLDSDNDGIADVLEVNGTDVNNDGKVDGFTDIDTDGLSDNVDGDVGNDGATENAANALLRTGADPNNDGRADNYPYKNFDSDTRPQPYDLDSDNDGISDVREAGFTDGNSNGLSDGAKGADGWDDTIDAQGAFAPRSSDGDSNPDFLDIDSDNDGIPDNVEAMATSSYQFPLGIDTDGDGIDNRYDNIIGFGGNGITPNNQDFDEWPDYIDLDTDSDELDDIIEGNDFNLNHLDDDNVTLTGVDTDGDGLDDRFDSNNSSIKGTSAYMGALGSFAGDAAPGSNTMVQRSYASSGDRDWRNTLYALDLSIFNLMGNMEDEKVHLRWVVTSNEVIDHFDIERSEDGTKVKKVGEVKGIGTICQATPFSYSETITGSSGNRVYYRIKAVTAANTVKSTPFIMIRKQASSSEILVTPNPASSYVYITCNALRDEEAAVDIIDASGKKVLHTVQRIFRGRNTFTVHGIESLPRGVYTIRLKSGYNTTRKKLMIQ